MIQDNFYFVFQSGFYDPWLNQIFSDFHVDVNKIIDLGNQMDINEVDALEYLATDEITKAIAIHIKTAQWHEQKKYLIQLRHYFLKPTAGCRVVPGSLSGGEGIIATDAVLQ